MALTVTTGVGNVQEIMFVTMLLVSAFVDVNHIGMEAGVTVRNSKPRNYRLEQNRNMQTRIII